MTKITKQEATAILEANPLIILPYEVEVGEEGQKVTMYSILLEYP